MLGVENLLNIKQFMIIN